MGERRGTDAFVCDDCEGLWLDRHALDDVCPTLSHLPDRRGEAILTGQRGAGIAACPRCQAVPVELSILEVAIDFCPGCGGVWFDGGEYGEPDVTGSEPRHVEPEAESPYRRAQIDEADPPLRCAYCEQLVERQQSHMRERGLACTSCHYALEKRLAALRAESGPLQSFLNRISEILENVARS